jgi:hypothetical protein
MCIKICLENLDSNALPEKLSYCRAARLLLIFLCLFFLVGAKVYSQVNKTGANDSKANEVMDGENLMVWVVPAEQKVRPEDGVETNNLIWSKEKKKINVAGAGNEHVPFQVVITAPVPAGRRPQAAAGFFIKASSLTSKQGKTIPQAQISFYLEHYIMLYGKSSPIGETGYWPDALAPIKEPFTMAAQYAVVRNRPIWVDLSIPSSTPGGTYTGTITVTQNGKRVETLNVEVEVYNFSLPDKTHLITYMNVSK